MTLKNLIKGILFGAVTAVLFIVLTGIFQPGLRANSEINISAGDIAIQARLTDECHGGGG